MNILKNINILCRVCFVVSLASLSSCSDDEGENSGQVELLSFGPAGVKHGEEISFIGNNLDKVTAIELTGVSVPGSSFVEHTKELIVLVVPRETEEGPVTLKTPGGDVISKTEISFEVPVTIASITPQARPDANITITGDFMNWVKAVNFAEDVSVTTFVSQSMNELVVTVPREAKTGPIVLLTGGTAPLTIETESELVVTLPAITGLTPNPVERGAELAITGTDLDLTMGILFKGVAEPVTDFEIKSPTELVVTVPLEANQGKISLVTHSSLLVESGEALTLVGALPPLAPLATAFYVDALENGWQKWGGWGGGSSDVENTDNVRDGEKAINVVFNGDWGGSLQLGGGNSSTTDRTEVVFSIFGGPGTNGKELNAIIKGGTPEEKIVTIVEGEWVEFKVPLADLGNPAAITEFVFQDRGWSGIIYADHIGLR